MRVGLELLARRVLWHLTPPMWHPGIELWGDFFVDTTVFPAPPHAVRVLDLGAYHGHFTQDAALSVCPRQPLSVALYEPVFYRKAQATVAVLSMQYPPEQFDAAVHRDAVWDVSGQRLRMYCPTRHDGLGSSVFPYHRDVRLCAAPVISHVPSIALTDLLRGETEVHLLKCNIEGAEIKAFNAVPDELLMRCRQIIVDFHGHVLPNAEQATTVLRMRLAALGFTETVMYRFGPTVRFVRKPH